MHVEERCMQNRRQFPIMQAQRCKSINAHARKHKPADRPAAAAESIERGERGRGSQSRG
jgi:hypothetical protein